MESVSVLDIFLFLGISQGLFLAFSLLFTHNRNRESNKVLALILCVAALMLFGRVVVFRITDEWVWRLGTFVDTSIFLFAPLLYVYVRRLAFSETPKYKLSIEHYFPAFLHFVYFAWTLSKSAEELYALYRSGLLPSIFMGIETLGLLSFYFYWIKSALLLKKYKSLETHHLSYKQSVQKYLGFMLGILFVLILFWSISYAGHYLLEDPIPHINYTVMWISTPLFIYLIGYFSINQPEIFRMPLIQKGPQGKDRLGSEETKDLKKKLDHFINEEKLFLDKGLTLKNLAEKLNTSPNNLSWLLNHVYQISFYDFINQKRIAEFQKKVNEGRHQHHTLFALAMEVGFNSKSTFNKAFKTLNNDTPKNYIENLELNV